MTTTLLPPVEARERIEFEEEQPEPGPFAEQVGPPSEADLYAEVWNACEMSMSGSTILYPDFALDL